MRCSKVTAASVSAAIMFSKKQNVLEETEGSSAPCSCRTARPMREIRSDARSFGRDACLVDDASEGTDHVDWLPALSNALASPVEKWDLAESWQRSVVESATCVARVRFDERFGRVTHTSRAREIHRRRGHLNVRRCLERET